jgi:hypothetical protein
MDNASMTYMHSQNISKAGLADPGFGTEGAEGRLEPYPGEASGGDAEAIGHSDDTQGKLPPLGWGVLPDEEVAVDVGGAPQETLPEDEGKDGPDMRDPGEDGLGDEEEEGEALEDGGDPEALDGEPGDGGAGDEDAELVESLVGDVEVAELGEGDLLKGEEERGGDSLVDGVFGPIDKEEGEHVGEEEGASEGESLAEALWEGELLWWALDIVDGDIRPLGRVIGGRNTNERIVRGRSGLAPGQSRRGGVEEKKIGPEHAHREDLCRMG